MSTVIVDRQMQKDKAVKPHKKGRHALTYAFAIQKTKGFSTFSWDGVVVTTTHTNRGTYTELFHQTLDEVEQVIATYKMLQKLKKMGFDNDYNITIDSVHYETQCQRDIVSDHSFVVNGTHYVFV